MTRLKETDIADVGNCLAQYNQWLIQQTGRDLAGIALHSLGKNPDQFVINRGSKVGVIPVSSGQGIIGGFSATVQAIIEFLGFDVFATERCDVGGLAEAIERGAEILFLADDDTFTAINRRTGKVCDNGDATGRGYAAALDLMAGGLAGKKILLLGAGPVGTGAARYMNTQGATVLICDLVPEKAASLAAALPGTQVAGDLEDILPECELLLEATPSADYIKRSHVDASSLVAAPGIPLGVDEECRSYLADRLIHDVLEIGVATMLYSVACMERSG